MLLLTETYVLFFVSRKQMPPCQIFLYVVLFVFLLFYVTGVEQWSLFFFQIMILEKLHFCLANHVCVSHLLHGQPHLLECYYWNCIIGTHMCVHPVSEWSDFFTLPCELFTSCNVSSIASLVSAQTGGERWSTKCGQAWAACNYHIKFQWNKKYS